MSSELPLAPEIFHGRESELAELVRTFTATQQAHSVICGLGGSGKSSLALKVIHDPDVARVFGDRRYFISCDNADGLLGLLSTLGAAFGLPPISEESTSGYKPTLLTFLVCANAPSLIVLDNLGEYPPIFLVIY